jgi:hypothetical protein
MYPLTAAQSLEWAKNVYEPTGCISVVAWGGVLNADFDERFDDVDLVVAYSGSSAAPPLELLTIGKRLAPFGFDTMLVSEDELKTRAPLVHQIGIERPRRLHPVEVYLIREASRHLCGSPTHLSLPRIGWSIANAESTSHMLEGLREELVKSTTPTRHIGLLRRFAVQLLRDLATFDCGHNLSKRSSRQWIINRYRPGERWQRVRELVANLVSCERLNSFPPAKLTELLHLGLLELAILLKDGPILSDENTSLNGVIDECIDCVRSFLARQGGRPS